MLHTTKGFNKLIIITIIVIIIINNVLSYLFHLNLDYKNLMSVCQNTETIEIL